MAIFFWKGKWWKAQAVKGREQTTKATVPERYQDETQAEVQEFVRLNNAIREERRKTAHLNDIFQAGRGSTNI